MAAAPSLNGGSAATERLCGSAAPSAFPAALWGLDRPCCAACACVLTCATRDGWRTFGGGRRCDLVWQGLVKEACFKGFKAEVCSTLEHAQQVRFAYVRVWAGVRAAGGQRCGCGTLGHAQQVRFACVRVWAGVRAAGGQRCGCGTLGHAQQVRFAYVRVWAGVRAAGGQRCGCGTLGHAQQVRFAYVRVWAGVRAAGGQRCGCGTLGHAQQVRFACVRMGGALEGGCWSA